MAKRDFYEVLGVDKNADSDTLKSAYRKMAMKYHPDRNQGNAKAEANFKAVNEAYEILRDDQKRGAYDRFGHAAFEQNGGAAGQGGASGFGGFSDIFEEMFGDFMGGGASSTRQTGGNNQRGADRRYDLSISLEEAFWGKAVELRVPINQVCDHCHGTGAEDGAKPVTCSTCGGSGKVRISQGFFTIERTCHTCGGQGTIIDKPCNFCHGTGRRQKPKNLSVNIPAGVDDGTRIRLTGEGDSGLKGAQSGDLYIFLTVKPHTIFQRDGAGIFCQVPVSIVDATLGSDIEVPTIDGGRARIKVPEGTQHGQQFRLRGKGMKVLNSDKRGDMYVEMALEVPVNLSRKQKDMLKDFREAGKTGKAGQQPQSEGFFSKVREFWDDLTE